MKSIQRFQSDSREFISSKQGTQNFNQVSSIFSKVTQSILNNFFMYGELSLEPPSWRVFPILLMEAEHCSATVIGSRDLAVVQTGQPMEEFKV